MSHADKLVAMGLIAVFFGPTLGACSEYQVRTPDKEAPEGDPETTVGDEGSPPTWSTCTEGWSGSYYNLTDSHPDVLAWNAVDTGLPDEPDPTDTGGPGGFDTGSAEATRLPELSQVDWFEREHHAFDRYDAHLQPGAGWFPVDEDLAGDPEYFAVRWRAWIRPEDNGSHDFVIGTAGALWIEVNGELAYSTEGSEGLASEVVAIDIAAGQKPITVTYAHLGGDSGLRLESLSDKVDICPPE